jgi:hypothetical protein
MELTNNKLLDIRVFTALASLILSLFVYFNSDIINRDGILYINLAEAYIEGGLAETVKLYNWPFYPILIASINQLTSFPLEDCAHLLNALLLVLMLDTLLLICNKLLDGNYQQLSTAAVLFICFQPFNEYRDFIIRDFGYWAFCCLTLYRFIIFLEKPSIQNATIWQIVAVIAVLFRIEGIVILIGLPLYLFIHNSPMSAVLQIIKLNYLYILISPLVIGLATEMPEVISAFNKVTTIVDYTNLDTLLSAFNQKSYIIQTQILNHHSAHYSGFILSSGLIAMLIYKLIKATSFSYLSIYLLARWHNKKIFPTPYRNLIIYFFAINVLILLTFLFKQYSISQRYSIVAVISLILLALPRLTGFIVHAWSSQNKVILSVLGLILFIGLVDSITSSRSKTYIKDTAIWARTHLPEKSSIVTNDIFIKYYYNNYKPKTSSFLKLSKRPKRYRKYDYLILVEKNKDSKLNSFLSTMEIEKVYSIETKRKNKATVYKVLLD